MSNYNDMLFFASRDVEDKGVPWEDAKDIAETVTEHVLVFVQRELKELVKKNQIKWTNLHKQHREECIAPDEGFLYSYDVEDLIARM